MIFLAHRFSHPQHWFPLTRSIHRREGHLQLGRALPQVLQTLSPVWFNSTTRKRRRVVGLSWVQILALPLTCRETVGKVFELSFSSLNWDDKIDLNLCKDWIRYLSTGLIPDLWTGVDTSWLLLLFDCQPLRCVLYVVVQKKLALLSLSVLCTHESVYWREVGREWGASSCGWTTLNSIRQNFTSEVTFLQKTFYKIPQGRTSWNVTCSVYINKSCVKMENMHMLSKGSRNMCWLTRQTKKGIIRSWEEEKGEKEAPVGWILGPWKSFLPPSCLSLTYNHTGTWLWALRAWKLVLKLVMWLHTFFSGQPQFSLFYHSEVLLNSRFSVTGDQKQDKTREVRFALC